MDYEVTFSAHAMKRMKERKISVETVQEILLDPDAVIQQSFDKYIYHKKVKGRKDNSIAVVVVEKKKINFLVITVMIHFEVYHENHPPT